MAGLLRVARRSMARAGEYSEREASGGKIVPRGTIARAGMTPDREGGLLDEIASLQERLAEAERLAVLGQLTATIAHEFNNLLTPVLSYSEMALERPDDAALTRKALERAYEGSLKAGQISQAILGLAAGFGGLGGVGGVGGAEVAGAMDGALRCLGRDLIKDRIVLRREIGDGTRATISAIGLQQVLLNLVLNARRAMLGGEGTLTVRSWVVADADVVATMSVATKEWSREGGAQGHMARQGGEGSGVAGWVVVLVGDTGGGMTAAEVARVMGEGEGSRESRVASRELRGWGGEGKPGGEGQGALASGTLPHSTSEGSGDVGVSRGGEMEGGRGLVEGAVARGGAGLGLMLCRKLVAAAGGWMECVSEVGRGTVMGVVLPRGG